MAENESPAAVCGPSAGVGPESPAKISNEGLDFSRAASWRAGGSGGPMFRIGWVEGIGYLASLLVFCTFYMKTMIPLRCVAIASNVAFMSFGIAGRVYPVLVLHAVLLPLNCVRLRQMQLLIRRVREASQGDLSVEWLTPLMTHQTHEAGHVLFRIGEPANSMF